MAAPITSGQPSEQIDTERRNMLRRMMAFAGGAAANGMIPAPTAAIAKALTQTAGASTLAVYKAVLSASTELGVINANLQYMLGTMMEDDKVTVATQGWDPEFSAAYDFGNTYGSPEQYQQEVADMVGELREALHTLHELKPTPAQIQASLDHLRTLYPSHVLAEQEKRFFADWFMGGDSSIAAIEQELQAPYDALWKHHHTDPDFQKGVDDEDIEREACKEPVTLPNFGTMGAARKAAGHPIPAHYTHRESVIIGAHHTSSGERYEHLGTIAPRGHISTTKS